MRGVLVIEADPIRDERGFFARTFCRREFDERGLVTDIAQCSRSFNRFRGTLRGLHYQRAPFEETKLVRCTAGAIYDVVVDVRRETAEFGHWFSLELSAENGRMVYIPPGVAHGFQTLTDESEVFYQISQFYSADHAMGLRWDDPLLAIRWPISNPIVSLRDRGYELLQT